MSLSKLNDNLNIIQSLANKPALEPEALKMEFDKAGNIIKNYINEILTKEIETTISNFAETLQTSCDQKMTERQKIILETTFPIGSRYITQDDTNPNTILGFGTWERSKGKIYVGLDENDADFNEIGKTGGEKTHTLTIEEMPTHSHPADGTKGLILASNSYAPFARSGVIDTATSGLDWDTQIAPQGGGQPHNILQPYEVVGYVWIRRS